MFGEVAVRSWQRRQVSWMLVDLFAPTAARLPVLWQPAPVAAHPAEEAAACSVASTEAWTASAPVWQAAHALVVSLADQLLAIAVVDTVLLWQFRQVFRVAGLGRRRQRVLGGQTAVRPTWQASHAVLAKVALAWAVLVGACFAAG